MREEFSFKFNDTTICFVQMYNDSWICSLPSYIAERLKRSLSELSERSIDELELSVRASNVLRAERLFTIYEVIQCSESQLRTLPNCGRTTVKEIKLALDDIGLQLRNHK
jgi:DNA-directed RNA polymerase alpha subunit